MIYSVKHSREVVKWLAEMNVICICIFYITCIFFQLLYYQLLTVYVVLWGFKRFNCQNTKCSFHGLFVMKPSLWRYSCSNVTHKLIKIQLIIGDEILSLTKTFCFSFDAEAGFPTSSTRASSSSWRCRQTSMTAASGTSETQPSSHGLSWWVNKQQHTRWRESHFISV